MGMEESLIARLKAASGAEVLTEGPNRVTYFERVRGAGLPALSVMSISNTDGWTHDGPTGFDWVRVRIDEWATTRTGVIALKRVVRAEMQVAKTVDNVRFQRAERLAERTIDEGEQEGGEPLFHVQQEFGFYYEEL